MAILERNADPSDMPDTIRDLVRGFAILARLEARSIESRHAQSLHAILQRLLERAERLEWEETADIIREADGVVARNIAPLP